MEGLEGNVSDIRQVLNRFQALQKNSCVAHTEHLVALPNKDGQLPDAEGLEFPPTINHLLVAGTERLPGIGEVNSWSKAKSRRLLEFYDEAEGYDSETDNEFSSTARSMRLRLARTLGVSQSQLQMASMSLLDA